MAKRSKTADEPAVAKRATIVASIGAIKPPLNGSSDSERMCRDAVVSVGKDKQAFAWISDTRTLSVTDAIALDPMLVPTEIIPHANGTASLIDESPDWSVEVSHGSKQKVMSHRAVAQYEKPPLEFPDALVRAGLAKDDPGIEWYHFTPSRLEKLLDSIGAQKGDDIAIGLGHVAVGSADNISPILVVVGAHGVAIVTCPIDKGIKPLVQARKIEGGKSLKAERETPDAFLKRVLYAACKSWSDSFPGGTWGVVKPAEQFVAWSERYGIGTREVEWHDPESESTGKMLKADKKKWSGE